MNSVSEFATNPKSVIDEQSLTNQKSDKYRVDSTDVQYAIMCWVVLCPRYRPWYGLSPPWRPTMHDINPWKQRVIYCTNGLQLRVVGYFEVQNTQKHFHYRNSLRILIITDRGGISHIYIARTKQMSCIRTQDLFRSSNTTPTRSEKKILSVCEKHVKTYKINKLLIWFRIIFDVIGYGSISSSFSMTHKNMWLTT